jgi:hypothetical protein
VNNHGDQYQEALGVYREFLMTLDSDVLRVYAECTVSPVDDEICARLRRIQEDIADEERQSTWRMQQLEDLDRFLKSVYQLTDRLHVYVRRSTIPLRCPSDFVLQEHLDCLRSGAQDTSEVWAVMRRAIAEQFGIDVEQLRASGEYESASTFDESFLSVIAHETDAETAQSNDESTIEILDIVSVPADQAEDEGHQIGFRTIAVCRSEVDAAWLAQRLQSDGVRCFVHSPISSGTDVQSGMCYVMVSPRDLAKARKMIETLRENDQF